MAAMATRSPLPQLLLVVLATQASLAYYGIP
jgi:hypothetical protein